MQVQSAEASASRSGAEGGRARCAPRNTALQQSAARWWRGAKVIFDTLARRAQRACRSKALPMHRRPHASPASRCTGSLGPMRLLGAHRRSTAPARCSSCWAV
eukprot:9730404-Alexandrium_andersonii.AAC.1